MAGIEGASECVQWEGETKGWKRHLGLVHGVQDTCFGSRDLALESHLAA